MVDWDRKRTIAATEDCTIPSLNFEKYNRYCWLYFSKSESIPVHFR
jgi:hypothetical protein